MPSNLPCHVHEGLPLVPVWSEMNPIDSFSSCFLMMFFNIIILSVSRCSKWPLSLKLSNFVCISYFVHAWFVPHLSHPSWFEYPTNIWWRVQQNMKLLLRMCIYWHFRCCIWWGFLSFSVNKSTDILYWYGVTDWNIYFTYHLFTDIS